MSEQVAQEIQKKILRERNIIVGASNLKKKTSNAMVIQKCNSNIQEAQQNIDYLNERLNQLRFQETNIPNSSNDTLDTLKNTNHHQKSNVDSFSRLDLVKYDCPSLGQRIQYMINQLNTKLKVEQKYYEANEKLSKIYQLDGDRRISSVAEDGRIQSNHKIQLLKKSLKRYADINISLDQVEQTDDDNEKFRRKPLAGTLTIGVNSIRDVDHIESPLFSRKTESYISIKVDDEEKAKTKLSRSDKFHEEFNLHIEKGNELEVTVYDKISGSFVPVAIAWFLIADIAEEIRKKKVGQSGVGWVSASRIQSSGNTNIPPPNTIDNFTSNDQTNNLNNASNNANNLKDPIRTSSWYILEPAGQILLTFGFTKSLTQNKKTLLGGLHRNGAIRKRDEEVFEQHGHQFVQKQFYSIMRCALCGDFLRYTGFQCQDCKFLCHKKCYEKVITKCISKSSTDIDPDELKINHKIPHRFEHVSNKGTNWCCHCGYILPWGRKNVLKCQECDAMCHVSCSHLVPDFCGMSMETANEILKTIKSTEVNRKKQILEYNRKSTGSSSTLVNSSRSKELPASPSIKNNLSAPALTQPPKEEPLSSDLPTQSLQQQVPVAPQSAPLRRPPPSNHNIYPQESQLDPRYQQQQQQHQMYLEQQRQVEEKRLQQERQFAEERRQQILEEKQKAQRLEQQQQQQVNNQYNTQKQAQLPEIPQEEDYSVQLDISFQQDYDEESHANVVQVRKSLEIIKTEDNSPDLALQKKKSAPISSSTSHHSHKRHRPKVGLDDFNFIAVLGRGNFGKVMLGRSHRTKQLCAVKILKKDMIIENGEIQSMQAEKEVFLIANREQHPFLTNLHCSFQTANRIYFVMEYVSGGDLMWHVQQGNFSLRRAKFYAAEVLLALKYLHENGIVYRDLKLDNIMLSTEGHIKLADYGLCKPDMWYGKTTNTFCGTPEFMAPEILKEQNYTRAVDWWAFGVLVYQMLLGKSPFRGDDEDEVFNAILTDEPLFPIQMASEAVGLLESLLEKNPQERLGSGARDAEEIMEHPYFGNINFDDILNLRVPPPYIPEVKSEEDVSFFDRDFTTEVPRLTPVNSVLDSSTQAQFRGFSYVNELSGL